MRTEITLNALSAILSLGYLASPVAADTWLGGLDISRACREQYSSDGGQGPEFWGDGKKGEGCNDWFYYSTFWPGDQYSIDTNLACAKQHGGGFAWCTSGIYDWSCYAP